MSSVDFVIKLRDACQMIADAANEYLETMTPKETKARLWDPSKIQWSKREGEHGLYEKATPDGQTTNDYQSMIDDLKAHSGKLSHDGFFYWLFIDQISVGRKPQKAKQ